MNTYRCLHLQVQKFYDMICHIQCCKCCLFLYGLLFKVEICFWRSRHWISNNFQGWIVLNYHNIVIFTSSHYFAKCNIIKGIFRMMLRNDIEAPKLGQKVTQRFLPFLFVAIVRVTNVIFANVWSLKIIYSMEKNDDIKKSLLQNSL